MSISELNKLWHIHIKSNVVIPTEVRELMDGMGWGLGREQEEALLADPKGKGNLLHPHCSRLGLSLLACWRLCPGRAWVLQCYKSDPHCVCVCMHKCAHAWVCSVLNRLTKTVNTTFISQKEERLIKKVKLRLSNLATSLSSKCQTWWD